MLEVIGLTSKARLTVQIDQHIKSQAQEIATRSKMDLDTIVTLSLENFIRQSFIENTSEDSSFPDIWNDDPQDIAKFNQEIGLSDDGR